MQGSRPASALSYLKCFRFSLILEFYKKLATQMEHVQKHAWAPSTFKTISSQWKAFKEYCREANVRTLPISDSEICFFAIWLTSTGRVNSKGSLAQYVSAVRTVFLRPLAKRNSHSLD